MAARPKKKPVAKRETGNRPSQGTGRWRWLNAGIVVALVGGIGAVIAAIVPHYLDSGPPPAPHLEVDSVTAQSYAELHPGLVSASGSEPGYETLDFKLRNTGDQVAYIDAVRVTVHSVEGFNPNVFGTFVPVSASYGLTLPTSTGTFVAPVSEQLATNQVDRFDLIISLPKNTPNLRYVYDISLALVYDQGNTVSAGKMILSLSPGYTAGGTIEVLPSPSASVGGD